MLINMKPRLVLVILNKHQEPAVPILYYFSLLAIYRY